jgi:hypothetical protein
MKDYMTNVKIISWPSTPNDSTHTTYQINNWYVGNSREKDRFIKDFKQFLYSTGDIVVKYLVIGDEYTRINTQHLNIRLYSISTDCDKPSYVSGNINKLITTNKNLYDQNNPASKNDCLITFLNRVRQYKPWWYKPNEFIDASIPYKHFIIEYKSKITFDKFSAFMKNILYAEKHIINVRSTLWLIQKIPSAISLIKTKVRVSNRKIKYINADVERAELVIVEHLKNNANLLINTFTHNKAINNTWRVRPDILYRFDSHCIIVEIDENQHRYYKLENEQCRTNYIISALQLEAGSELPVVFIRYNPDSFKVNGHDVNIPETDRLEELVSRIDYYINNIPSDLVIVEYMYFDTTV